ncbi:Non-ribosomal peptide synthetase nps1 [Coccidioides immitis]|nr:Non-ribosomal peptide synthetase nps1 [Coccidioides immitis]
MNTPNSQNGRAENGVNGQEGPLVFREPAFALKSNEELAESLLLGWILLLYRGSNSSEDASFSCEYGSRGDDAPKEGVSGLITDVILEEVEQVSLLLERVRNILRRCRISNTDPGKWKIFSAVLSNSAALTEDSRREVPNEPFCIEAQISGEELSINKIQTPALKSPSMVNISVQAFVEILDSILSDTNQTIAQAIRVTNNELDKIWEWNETVPPTIDTCIHDIFIENASRHPERPAVVSWDGGLSYREVDEFSTQLAMQLIDSNVKIGEPIMLCFEKCMWTVVAVLAVMKSGGTLVLTDPSQPEARLQTIATEVNVRLILTSETQAKLGARISSTASIVSVGPSIFQSRTQEVSKSTLPKVPGSSALYIIFTSGSTGKPKGVVISHTNYTSGAIPRAAAVGYNATSRVLDFPSYAFDVSIDCMLCTLANGGCICVPSEDQRVNDLGGAIRDMNVNMAHMTPSVARVLDSDILESLDVLGLGGEAVSARDAAVFGHKTKVIIAYGPSECTVGCTINNDVGTDRTYTTIGKGVGCATWIVDPADHDRLTPVGAVGELLVEGPIVGKGYLNNLANTSTVFIENPPWLVSGNGNVPGRQGRLYKTGDLVKYDPDGSGSIFFVGRADQQVKLRGQRVELGEIEYHLRTKLPPGTMSAVEVITPGGNKESATLVAFIAEQNTESAESIDSQAVSFSPGLLQVLADIQSELGVVLPRYMIPAAYIPLKEIPLLVSCKTDRKQLRAIGAAMSRRDLAKLKITAVEKHEVRTDMERRLHGLWTQVLGDGTEINTNDNFFDAGGDSLKAMKLVAAARQQKLKLTVAEIFGHPTLQDMALVVKQIDTDIHIDIPPFSLLPSTWAGLDPRTDVGNLCSIEASAIEDIYPCTPLQEGLMALSAKISEAYVAQRVVELSDWDTAVKLKAAFDTTIADCPILRTRIVQVPRHGLMQVIIKENITWHSSNSLEQYLQEDRETPMGLGTALSRFALIEDQTTCKVHIVLTIHHALYDGWSMPLVVERVNGAYNGIKMERPTPFRSFIKYLNDMDRAASESYWTEQLQGASSLQFPVLPEPGYQPQAESLLEHYIPLTKRSASSTSIATAIRGAWALLASEYTMTDDVVFGETLTGRNAPIEGIEQIEGPMITTVPIRIHVDKMKSVSDYLKEIHNEGISRIPHEHLGLQHIRRLNSDAREACELRTGLVIHPTTEADDINGHEANPADGFVPAGDIEAASEALKFNSYSLMLVCSLDPRGILVMASFDSKTVDVPQMNRVLRQLGHIVQQFCEQPNSKVADALSSAEEDALESLRLSRLGPSSLDEKINTMPGHELSGAVATWIVNPAIPDHVLPVGAAGELLVEGPFESSLPAVDTPLWLIGKDTNNGSSKRQIYTTNKLAKYRSDGTIIFLSRVNSQKPVDKVKRTPVARRHSGGMTAKEQKLVHLWGRVLGMDESEIDIKDSFFELGGDSIGAMKLVSEARMEGFKLTVAEVFKHKYLNELAEVLVEFQPPKAPTVNGNTEFSLLDTRDVKAFVSEEIRPSLADQSWKILDVLPARPLQTIAVKGTVQLPRYSARYELFYFNNHVDEARLFESCQELVTRNEILRTVFTKVDGRYYGIVLEQVRVPIEVHEIERDIETYAHNLCHLDVETTMPLGSSFVKFLFVRCTDGRGCLILRISHAQYDEICLPVLLRQLSALYERKVVPKALPFSSYVQHVVKENILQSIQYWRELLKGSSLTVLRPETPLESKIPAAVYKTFDISARPKDITVATIPTAAWALCLAKRLSLRDVTFGEVVSGRNIDFPNSDIVMGPCWQYIPVRVKFEDKWTGRDLLDFVQHQHIASTRFEGIGLTEIVEKCTVWPETVDWFDSVVHQDVEHVESLGFLSATSRMETIYPHAEPLREWKIQAFLKDNKLSIEIVTFESWLECARSLLDDIEKVMGLLLEEPLSRLFNN